jgi:hypothetical protein
MGSALRSGRGLLFDTNMTLAGEAKQDRAWKILVLSAIVLIFVAALPVLPSVSRPVAAWFHSYHVWQYRGQGSILYLGPFRPSYRVTWHRVPIDREGQYQYGFRGLPTDDQMNLSLRVSGSGNSRAELKSLRTVVAISLVPEKGAVICGFEGPLGGISEDNPQWALESSFERESFFHSNCTDVGVRGDEAYILRIRVKEVDPRSPHTFLTPTLEWGGVDLP